MTTQGSRTVRLADPQVSDEAKERVLDVLDSGQLAAGDVVGTFEREFADYCGTEHAVATANGTAALHAALAAVGVDEGSTVVTTPLSFVATANAVRLASGSPTFADVDPSSGNLDPAAVEETVRNEDDPVDAILPVHLYGLPAEMDALREVADRYDAALVEDAAQAHGARYRDRPVGSLGDLGCFSFYPTKNMTTGEGGMIVTDDDGLARTVRSFVDHGRDPDDRSVHERVGHNFRLPDVAAAIGRSQLERLPEFVAARRRNASALDEMLAETDVVTPPNPAAVDHAYHQYTVYVQDRDRVREALEAAGIGTGVYYERAIHQQPAYRDVSVNAPVAERLAAQVLSLPVHPGLTSEDLEAVATAVIEATSND